ncbi:hypothetical protein LOZ61_006782 [Ophidiomyces ophidiicola]|nr:hypothetical protein LOZ61_006782 [Ophidiomyces ophidiicola]
MDGQIFQRRVYDGAKIDGVHTISSMRFKKFEHDERFHTQLVEDLSHYESGCHLHGQCFGHMCRTRAGIVLPPQSMSMRMMEIATEYYAASKLAFAGDLELYKAKLMETNYTKSGTMRCTMSTPVAGSCRLIATPQWEFGKNCIAISSNLASRMKVCKKIYDESGNVSGTYIEAPLQENDWVIVVRPPSLHFGNTQPLRIRFWDKDVIGIHPETFSMYHGDFDGDEAQIYPVYDLDSIVECESWTVLPLDKFVKGRRMYDKICPKFKKSYMDANIPQYVNERRLEILSETECDPNGAEFLEYTTLSAKQLADGNNKLYFGEVSRNKNAHIQGMFRRFVNRSTETSFVSESIRGTEDVRRQQLSQGMLGDMTRIAKIAASCFYRHPNGGLYIVSRDGNKLLCDDSMVDIGSPTVRAVSQICAVAQQAALDSHRAEAHDSISHDFVADLILGCERTVNISPTSSYTFVQFDVNIPETISRRLVACKWRCHSTNGINTLCRPSEIPNLAFAYVTAAYNPVVLTGASRHNLDVRSICLRGLKVVCNYYGVNISDIELKDISFVFSYKPDASHDPVTTRNGMTERSLGWIETLLATDYTRIQRMGENFEIPNTTTAAMFMANFSNLKLKYQLEEHV